MLEEDVVANSIPISDFIVAGVYFLINEGEVVYIGQSDNIHARIKAHATGRDTKMFDRIHVIECSDAQQRFNLEGHYINTFDPPLNKQSGLKRYKYKPK